MSSRTLILAGAFMGELEPFMPIDETMLHFADSVERLVLVREAGIGNVAAAIAVMRWFEQSRAKQQTIDEIVFVGSCGRYSAAEKNLPGLVLANRFCSYELASLEEPPRSKIPGSVGSLVSTERGFAGDILSREGTEQVVVNAPGSVTLVSVAGEQLKRMTGCLIPFVENLETFGMARAALECGLHFSALMAVTNTVGPQGSEEWQSNHRAAALLVREHLAAHLFLKK